MGHWRRYADRHRCWIFFLAAISLGICWIYITGVRPGPGDNFHNFKQERTRVKLEIALRNALPMTATGRKSPHITEVAINALKIRPGPYPRY